MKRKTSFEIIISELVDKYSDMVLSECNKSCKELGEDLSLPGSNDDSIDEDFAVEGPGPEKEKSLSDEEDEEDDLDEGFNSELHQPGELDEDEEIDEGIFSMFTKAGAEAAKKKRVDIAKHALKVGKNLSNQGWKAR